MDWPQAVLRGPTRAVDRAITAGLSNNLMNQNTPGGAMSPILNPSRTAAGRDESRRKGVFWPRLESQPDIDGALDGGILFAFIVAGAGTLSVMFRILPRTSLVDRALFAGFGFGMAGSSRVFAIGAFAPCLPGASTPLPRGAAGDRASSSVP